MHKSWPSVCLSEYFNEKFWRGKKNYNSFVILVKINSTKSVIACTGQSQPVSYR